jgi:thiosulfate reductase cytochrome b subunit
MIWSGTLIYWANSVYKITAGSKVIFKFYPPAVYKALNISYRLAEGMSWHFVFMWFFFLNGLLYVSYILISGEWRQLIPKLSSFKDAWLVVLYDLHIRRTKPDQGKYNAAQRISYTAIIFFGIAAILSGLVMYKPVKFNWLTSLMGGYETARLIHFAVTIGFLLFFIVHIVQVILAGWNNFRSSVTGWEVVEKKSVEKIAEHD